MLNTMDGRCLLDMSRDMRVVGRTEHSGLNDHWVALLLNQDTALDPFCFSPSQTQLLLVSKAHRVAELTQCLAKGLHPGHRLPGCQHPGDVTWLILCFLCKLWGVIRSSSLWIGVGGEGWSPALWDLSYTPAT